MLLRNPFSRKVLNASLLVATTAACVGESAQAGPVLDRIRQSGKITLAHRESSIPFSYLDADKRPIGYTMDLCAKVSDAIRKHLTLKSLTPEYLKVTEFNQVAMIEQDKADLECGSTSNNAERREKVAFTIPHYITGTRFMVRADSTITDLKGFEGLTLVSTYKTPSLAAITRANKERLLRISIMQANDHVQATEMIEKEQADGFAMDDVLLYGVISSRPDPTKLKVVGKFLTLEPLSIVMSKNDPELKAIVDEEMKRLISSREAYTIYDRWFIKPIPPRNSALNIPMNYLLRDLWKYPTDRAPN
ncbi:MAG: amino acid ABC transporter substrate-binding protein [Pseudomonadota bacterium]